MNNQGETVRVHLIYKAGCVTATVGEGDEAYQYPKTFESIGRQNPHSLCKQAAEEIERDLGKPVRWSMEEIQLSKEEWKTVQAIRESGLDLDNYSEEDMRDKNADDIKSVSRSLIGSGLHSFGGLLMGGVRSDAAFQLEATKALIRQNWIIIRQNEQIIRELKKLNQEEE